MKGAQARAACVQLGARWRARSRPPRRIPRRLLGRDAPAVRPQGPAWTVPALYTGGSYRNADRRGPSRGC
ncbi:hypothetical protein PsYK624_031760 [Phanerochaete sordida]|uniref:Uncharacterized protein n=1 Tax=Phanerochaete sordida TaxID=48140 RepID=A0A9P3G153_9APHY|nr:hypothetical protein PsYK624_031760 [Phanerochaete sordida]